MSEKKELSEAISQLREDFIARLPVMLLDIASQSEHLKNADTTTQELGTLHRLVHSLAGNAGTFGMQALSDAAQRVESLICQLIKMDKANETEAMAHGISRALKELEGLAENASKLKEPCIDAQSGARGLWPQTEPLVLLVDDDPVQGLQFSRMFQQAGYRVRLSRAASEMSSAMQGCETAAAIVINAQCPDDDLAGYQCIRQLKDTYEGHLPPVVVLSAGGDLESRLAAYRSGFVHYLNRPVDETRLLRLLDDITLRIPQEPYRILMVDDEPLVLEAQASVLRAAGMAVSTLQDPRQTLQQIHALDPEVLVVDLHMPDITGAELAALLREDGRYLQLPIIFLSSETSHEWKLRALNLGGDDFLRKPVDPERFVSQVTVRARRAREYLASQVRMQQILYEREREHQALNQHAIVSISDRFGRITYVNDLFCTVSGYSREELLGSNHRILKSGQHAATFYDEMWSTIASGHVWSGELCNRRKDGSCYWVESTITPFVDEHAVPYQYVAIRTDITHVKAVEAEQRARVARQQMVSLSASELLGACAETLDTAIQRCLQWAGEHLGAERGYLFQLCDDGSQLRNTHEWCTADLEPQKAGRRDQFLEPDAGWWAQMERGGVISLPDLAVMMDDGGMRASFFETLGVRSMCAFPIGRPGRTQGFIGFAQVSRARAWDEDAFELLSVLAGLVESALRRRATEQALSTQQQFTQNILDSVGANIAVLDREGVIVAVNENWRRFAVENSPEGDLAVRDTGIGTNYLEACRKACSAGIEEAQDAVEGIVGVLTGRAAVFTLEYPCNSATEAQWFELTVAPMASESGQVVVAHTPITDRKLAEQAAQTATERLIRAQSYANIGTWEWNIVTGELFWSERIAPLFGYPAGDLESTYENFLAAVHPDDRQAVIDSVNACIECDKAYEIEHRVVWPDGTVRWLLERGAVQYSSDGKPVSMLGVVQDVDDRKRIELALAERKQQLLEAQRFARIGNWSVDVESGEMVWSDVIYEIFGYTAGEVAPRIDLFRKAVHPDDVWLVEQSERRALLSGVHDVVHRIMRPNGHVRYVHEMAKAACNAEGQLLSLQGTLQDVTEIKQAEQDLMVFRRVFDATDQGIGVSDAEGAVVYSNPAHDRLLGYKPSECLGMHFTQFFSEEAMQWAPETINGVLNNGSSWSGLLPVKRKDGSQVITTSNMGLVSGVDGGPQYLFNIMSDYTHELRRQQLLAETKEEAERASQAKSAFLSSMSHELRTPMNVILGFAQILEYDGSLGTDQQESVHEILRAGHHLLELINEVLDLSKVESGQLRLSLEPVEVRPLVEECLSLMQPLAQRRQISIRHAVHDHFSVRADHTRLKQAMLNLLSNAVKYNRDGGDVKVSIEAHEFDRLRILVSDTGRGLSREQLNGLFQPFNRMGAENTETEGTGIGLTITRRIMELMGGRVDVESEQGVGSTFWLELPLESQTQKTTTCTQHSEDKTERGQVEAEQLVLYIEDNPANLKLVSTILGRLPRICLLTAHLPELGLELARLRKPALILLDINMPGMDGYEVLELLKQDADLKEIPVLAVTANAMPRDVERGKQAGFAEYIAKPVHVGDFLDTVNRWLGQKSDPGA